MVGLLGRRDVLRRAATAGAAAVAVVGSSACGGSTPTARPDNRSQGSPTSLPKNTRLAATSEIPVGGGAIFADLKVVVTEPEAGTFRGFSAICTHLGCTVSSVENGTINCPCHGSKFSIVDGSVQAGPAPRPLPRQPITVSGGSIIAS